MTPARSPQSWRGLVGRFGGADRERLAAALVAGGTGVAIVTILAGGFVSPGRLLVGLLYPLAVSLPVLGLAIVAGALWLTRGTDRSSISTIVREPPPETDGARTEYPIGRETDRTLGFATQGWYRCQTTDSAVEIHDRLIESAIRVSKSRRGLEAEAAREAVRTGTWTDDPVAAAFLADDRRHPLSERLLGAVDPGTAYHRRVRRTLEAIEAIEAGTADRRGADR